jgi:DNA-binding transcriptional LysR family regulator
LTELALTDPADELRKAFPNVVLRLSTGWSRDIVERVRSGALDAGIVLLPEEDRFPAGLHGEELAAEELVIIGARSAFRGGCSAKDAAAAGWILNPDGCAARGGLQKALGRLGHSLRVAIETYNYELQMRLVARELGLGLVPVRLLKRSSSQRLLRTLEVRGLQFPMKIWLLAGAVPASLAPALESMTRSLRTQLGSGRRSR